MQDWTKQENEDAEGVVSFSYRTKPEEPPDVQMIQKQMAIVAWQPGPNRRVQVPSQVPCSPLYFSVHNGDVHQGPPQAILLLAQASGCQESCGNPCSHLQTVSVGISDGLQGYSMWMLNFTLTHASTHHVNM